ncbi:MAG TPA: OmpA family protein [Steroidobacteraceae bacterium]|jgi:outer membrane protein OmpA-like peptidoglycan-associated protein|nr:OmpA family protein [Steroidobacteraceae bacterium]
MRKTIGVLLGATLCWAAPLAAAPLGAPTISSSPRQVATMSDRTRGTVAKRELDIAEALLRKRLQGLGEGNQIAVLRDPLQVTLRMPASVLFDADSTHLKPNSLEELPLSAAVELLRKRYRLVGQINVYTDGIGGQIANHGLTEQRALALLAALHTTRIRPTRVAGAGLGAEAEIGPDETPEGRELNRRVELVFALPGASTR